MYTIQLIPKEKIHSVIPFMQLLHDSIPAETLEERLNEMVQNNYQCVGVYDGDKLIGISGLWILTKYYIGKHIEPDNVIIHPDYQGKKIGEQMMQWIYDYGKSIGCVASKLSCGARSSLGRL
jgi:GNAT superfamily N-acetyltransferase